MKKFLEWYRARQRIAETRTLLHTLSDHQLRDIGLQRDQIDYLRLEELPVAEAPRRPRVRAITVLRAS